MGFGEGWQNYLERWLEPFLAGLSHPARRRMCPLYKAGLIGPGDRKSAQPMAAQSGDVGYDQLHHFVAVGVWDSAPLEAALLKEADRLVGDERLSRHRRHRVAEEGAALGRGRPAIRFRAWQDVQLPVAGFDDPGVNEVPVMVGLRLFLPETWTAIQEIDRVIASGAFWLRAGRLEQRVRPDHPLRTIRTLVNEALASLDGRFGEIYSEIGRPSIPPEQLLRAMLLQAFYTVRSERQLIEQLDFNLLFRWFVGLGVDDPVRDASTFSKNRDRLLAGSVAAAFLSAVLVIPRVKRLLSQDQSAWTAP